MAQFRPFAITQTPGSIPSGTTSVGNIVIGVNDQGYNNLGGLDWFAGPDEELGYIIAKHNAANNQPTHISADNLYLDPTYKAVDISLSNSNKTAAQVFSYTQTVLGLNLINGSDKVMFSVKYEAIDSAPGKSYIGFGQHGMNISGPFNGYPGNDVFSVGFASDGAFWYNGTSDTGGLPTWVNGDIIDVVANIDGPGFGWIRVNGGNWNNDPSADPATNNGGLNMHDVHDFYPAICPAMYGVMTIQDLSTYSVPDGFNFFGNVNASVKFFRCPKNDIAFVELAQSLVEVLPATAANAKIQLNSNDYWTSYGETPWAYGYQ